MAGSETRPQVPGAGLPLPGPTERETLLRVEDLHAGYGQQEVLRGVSLAVRPGEVVCIIGPNGAGKSTLLRTVFGMLRPTRGAILLDGTSLVGRRPPEVLRLGVAYVPQGVSVLPNLTVEDNLRLGAYTRSDPHVGRDVERVFDLFPALAARRRRLARTLSGGERRMLEIARVLLLHPRLVLLDEPTIGLSGVAMEFIYEKIREFHRQGVAVLLVEQNARTALRHSHRAYVLEQGRVRFEGSGEEILDHPEVRRAYLGGRG
jgi:ABC-type branched-subunit amino acid transport system ATPase component